MADIRKIPTLSTDGFISDPNQKLEKLVVYFITAEHSQSNTFIDKVNSLKYLVAQYSENITKFKSAVELALSNLVGAYFDTVSVMVDFDEDENGSELSTFKLNIDITASNTDTAEYARFSTDVNVINGVLASYNKLIDSLYLT